MPAETNINNSGNTAVVPVSRSLLSKVSPAASSLLSSPVVRIISKTSLSATSLLSTKVSITNNKTMTTKLCVSTPTSTSNGVNSRTTMPALTTRVVTRTNTVKLPFDIDQGDEEVPPLSSASSTNDANNNREDGGGDDSDVEEELSNFFSKLDQSIKKNPNSHNQRISNVINRSGPGIQVVRATQRSILNLSGANHRTTLISKLSSITPTTRFTRILPRPSIPNSASHSPVTLNKSTLPIKITLNASSSGTTFSSVTPTVTGTIRKINIAPASSSNASSKSASNITTVQKNGTTSTPQKTPCFIVLSDGNNVRLKATDVKQLIQLKAASATSNTHNINIPTTGSSVITSKQLSIATLKKAPIGTTSPQVIQVKLQPKPKPEPEIVKVERPKEPETTQTLPVKEEFVDSEEEEEVQLIESVPQQKKEEEEQIVKPSDLLEVKLEEEEERQVNLVPEEREEDRISSPFDLDRTFWPDNSRIFDCDIPNLELLPAEALPPVPDFDDDSDYENYCDLIKPQVLVRVEGDSEQEEEEADNSEEELQIDEDYRPDEDQVKPSTSAFGTSYVNEPIDSECRAATDKGQFIIGQTVPHQRVHLHPGFALIVKSALNGQNQLTTVTSTGTTAATSTNNFTLINKSTPTTTFSTTTIGTSAYASTSILQTKSLPDGTKAIYTLAKVQPGTSNNNGIVSSANATGQSRVIKVINSQSGKTQPIIVKSVSQGNTAAGLPSGVKLVTLSKTSSFVTSNTASTPTNTLAPSTTSTTSSASGSKLNSRPFIIQVENNDGTMATTLALMLNQGSSAGNSSSTNKLITSPANSANTTTTSPASVGSSLLHRAAQIGASSTLANSLKNMTGFTTAAIAHSLNEYAYEATNDDIRMFLPGRQQPNSPQSIHNNSTVGNLVAGLPTSADLESLNKMDRECVNCGTTNTSQWRTNGNGHYLCNACGLYKKYNGEDRPPASIQQPRKRTNQAPKQCSNCGTLTSSMWRRTANKQVACNACGLYYKLYGVNRPIEMRKDIVYPRNRYSKLNGQTKNGASQSGASPKQNEREPVTYAKQQQAQQVKIQQASAVQQQRQYYASNIRTLHHSPEHVPQTASYMIGPDNKVLSNNSNNSTGTQQPKIIVISGNNKATILQNGVNFGSVLSPNTMLNTNQHQTAPPTSTPTIVTPTAMSSIVSNHNEMVSSSSPPQQQQYLTLKSSPGRNSPNETNIKQEPDDDDDVCTLEDSQDENSLLPQEDAEIIKMEPEILMHDNIKDELDDNGQELSPVSAVANAAAAAAAAAAASAPFQSLLELSALTANNPAAAQTQAALISAIIQSGSFPMQQDPTQLGSLLANSALAAVFQATANALSNGTFGAAAAAAVGLEGLTNGKGFVDGLNGSNGHHLGAVKGYTSPQPQECANCGTVSSTTQLRRYGNLAHYLCGKCTANSNHHVTQAAAAILNAASNNNSTPQQNRKNSDANSSDGDSHATSGRKAHSGRKVKTRDVQCTNCGVTKSSEWRRNVRGEIVCNACGLYYKLHNRDRPIHMRRDFIAHRKRTPNTNSQKIQAMKRLNEVNAENPVMDDYEGKNMIRLISGDQKKVQMIAIDASQQNSASPVHRISPPTSVRSVIHESGNSNSNFDDDEEIPIDDDLDEEGSSAKRIKLEHHHNQNTTDTEYSVPDSPTMNDCASVASSSGCSVETENTISSGCGSAVTSGGGKKRKQSNPKRVIAAAHSENNVTGTEETEVELEPEEDSVHSS